MRAWQSVVVASLVLITLHGAAQPLADRLPDDALIYVGWRGASDPGPAYPASRLKGFINASTVRQLISETLPKLLDKMAQQDRSAAMLREILGKLGPSLWNSPVALYVGPVDGLVPGGNPMPRMALLCQAGPAAAQMKKDINAYLDQIPRQELVPVVATEENGIVSVTLGNVIPDLSGKGNATLAHRKEFIDALAQVGKDPVAAMYVDVEGLSRVVDQAMLLAPPQTSGMWANIGKTLGLKGLKRAAVSWGFDGRDWSGQVFISAPAPREGLLQLIDAPPISDQTLAVVPQSATMMAAANLDLAKLLDVGRDIAGKFDPNLPNAINSGLAMAGIVVGLNIEQDLLKPLGDQWVLYSAPSVGGVGPLGYVVVSRPRNAEKLTSALTALERLANSQIDAGTPPNQPKANIITAKLGDVTVHYLNTPFVSPGWTIYGGNLYVALFPETVAAAAHAAVVAQDHKSILDNPDFKAMRQRLGSVPASSISFYDLPRSAPVGYPYLLAVTRVLGFADMFGMQTPVGVLPQLEQLTPLLAPAGSVAWADDAGLHAKTVTPFPGAELLAGPEMLLLEASGFIAPAITGIYKAREQNAAPTATPATKQ